MVGFKNKKNKNPPEKKITPDTVDTKHNQYVTTFQNHDEIIIPKLLSKKKRYKKQLETATLSIEQRLNITDNIKNITQQVQELRNQKKQYFLKNSGLLVDYFDNKKQIECGTNTSYMSVKTLAMNSFFTSKKEVVADALANIEQKENTVKQYFLNTDSSYIDIKKCLKQTDRCKYCNKGELVPIEDEGIIICNNAECSRSIPFISDHEKSSYKDPPKDACYCAYKRLNHFKEIVAQFQGKETTQIPNFLIDLIAKQFKKERIPHNKINYRITKEVLNTINYSEYYEHIYFINSKFGVKPPSFAPDFEEKLYELFNKIQSNYFSKHCPTDRNNFLNYHYTLYRLCELLGETKYLPYIHILNDRTNQDMIWNSIRKDPDINLQSYMKRGMLPP